VRKVVGILLLVFALFFNGQAEAQVISFDELSPADIPILGTVVCADGTGFRFFSNHFHLIGGTVQQDFTSNGTSHLGYESGRGFPITLERVGGGTFSLLSLDAGEFYYPATDRPDAEMLTITGFQQGGGTVSHTVNLDGLRDGPGGVDDFEHFVLPGTFVNLTSVVFTGLRPGNLDGGIAIDNIAYQLAAPEVLAACVATPLAPSTPTVSITSPLAGNVVGTVSIQANATDNIGVASVQFKVDGVNLGAADVTAPYSVSWDSTTVLDGPHTITAEATDTDNNLGTASVVVTVQNQPVNNTNPHYLELDGVDDFLQVADAPALSFGNGLADTPLTFEAWMRPDAMVRHQVVGKWASNNQEYQLHLSSGAIRLDLRDNSAGATVSAFASNQLGLIGSWHHLAVTYDGRGGATAANGITIYVDGVALPLARMNHAAYVAMENLSAPLLIGREGPAWKQFDGGLDEIRFWNVARTPTQIQTFMTTELTGVEAGLVAYWKFNEGSGTTVTDDGPASYAATLMNGPAWVAGGPMGEAVPDTTPPDITNIVIGNLTASGATISFTTSEVSTGWVSFSATAACPCIDVYSAGTGTTHVVTLTGLAPDTIYQVVVKATDAATNLAEASAQTFRTLLPPPDLTPPTAVMVRPLGGTVSGTVVVEATASDNVGVTSVQFKLDGAFLGAADTTAPYSVSWDTTTTADGPHTITAEASDAAGNLGAVSVAVTVSQTPVPSNPHYLELDGVDDYLQVADAPELSFGNGVTDTPLTFEAWLRPDAMARHQVLGKWASSGQEYQLHLSSNAIRLDMRDNSAGATVSAFAVNQSGLIGSWHHLAVTYDGRGGATAANGITIYVDGVALPLSRMNHAAYVAMENLAAPLLIGREGPAWKQLDGGLDEVRLWNVARTQPQIVGSMTTELSGIEAGLVAYWKFNEGTGTTVADDGPASHVATLIGATWVAGGPMGEAVVDTTPPAITNVTTSNLTASGVTISFTTSEVTTGWVSYSATAACPCVDVYSAGTGTAHAITLAGLAADTVYQFVARATDAATNLGEGSAMTFRTLLPPPDLTPPAVAMVRPLGGTVSGNVVVEATASDNLGVTSVQFKLDGVFLGAADTTAPYSVSWDTTTAADGVHTITAEARDAAGNLGIASVVVTVSQTPVVSTPHYLELDGADDYLQVADAPSLSFGNGVADTPLTFEAWLRPDAMVRHQVLGKWASGNYEYQLHLSSGAIRLDLRDNSSGATTSAFTASSQAGLVGAWHHLAVTYDGRGGATAANGITIYVDGVSLTLARMNSAAYVAMESLAAPLVIGREGPAWKQFDGGLDELRMWNVARTQSEIQASMATQLLGFEPGLVAYWKFNAGTGATADDDGPANHTATLISGPVWLAGGAPIP
jgi:hypothetical protein